MNWDQLRTIVWLRFRLTRNQFVRGGQLNAIVAILLLVLMFSAAVGLGVGGVVLGAAMGAKASAMTLLLAWDGFVFAFLVFWFMGLLVELQRSESVDMTKLLHLPVTLQQVFVFNYVASHFTPSIVILGPGLIGLCAGLVIGAGIKMAPLLFAVIGFLFTVTAWTYCLRGWLASLMVNKRKRRMIIMWITIGFVLLGQLPNIIAHSPWFRFKSGPKNAPAGQRMTSDQSRLLLEAHALIPPGWPGYSAMTLKNGTVWPAFGLACVGCLAGGLGLMRAYSMTIRFYRGADERAKVARVSRARRRRGTPLVERTLPWLPEEVAALALATFRSLLRAPELKMALLMPIIMAIIFGVIFIGKMKALPEIAAAGAATGAVVFAAFSIAPTMSNVFGLDRNGFRSLVLLPTRRDSILLAKNLAFFPFAGGVALIFLVLIRLLGHAPWLTVLTGLEQIPTAFLMFSLLCNLSSIFAPYRLAQGTLQAKKPKAIMFISMLASMLLTPVILLPVALPLGFQALFSALGWVPWLPINVLSALGIFAGVAWLYSSLLPWEGSLLQRREQKILCEVTEETE